MQKTEGSFFNFPQGFYSLWALAFIMGMAGQLFLSVFAVFFTDVMGFSQLKASAFYGSFFALSWGLTPIGGLLIDRVFGARLSLIVGSFLSGLGYLCLGIVIFTGRLSFVYPGFAVMLLGAGSTRACGIKLLSGAYAASNRSNEMHSGFALYYVSVNLAAIISLILGPTLRHIGSPHTAYGIIFFFSSLMICITLFVLFSSYRALELADNQTHFTPRARNILLVILGYLGAGVALAFLVRYSVFSNALFFVIMVLALSLFFLEMGRSQRSDRFHLALILFLSIESILFALPFTEINTALLFYELHNAQSVVIFGHSLDPITLQSFNPIWIVILSLLFALYYKREEKSGKAVPLPYKFAIGMAFSSLAFLTLSVSTHFPLSSGKISVVWFGAAHLFEALGEMLIAALGTSTVMRYAPQKSIGLVTGVWYLSNSTAMIIGGMIASHTGIGDRFTVAESLPLYSHFFGWFSLATALFFVFMFSLAPLLTKLEKS